MALSRKGREVGTQDRKTFLSAAEAIALVIRVL